MNTIFYNQNCNTCISYYQISRGWGVPYGTTVRLLEKGLNSLGHATTTGEREITESEFKLFSETFRISQTVSGRWELIPTAQLTLPGMESQKTIPGSSELSGISKTNNLRRV